MNQENKFRGDIIYPRQEMDRCCCLNLFLLTYTGWKSLITDSLIVLRVPEQKKDISNHYHYLHYIFHHYLFSFKLFRIIIKWQKISSSSTEWVYIPAERKENGAAILFSHQFPSLLVGGVVVLENARSCWTLGLSTARIRHFAGFSDTKAAKMWFHTNLFHFSSLDLNVEFRTKV